MNQGKSTAIFIAAIAAICLAMALVVILARPAASNTVRACTDVRLPDRGCITTRKTIHGYKVTVRVCK